MGAFFKHKEKDSASGDDCVKLCNVHDIIEAERMIELLKENGIAAFSRNLEMVFLCIVQQGSDFTVSMFLWRRRMRSRPGSL